MMNNISREKLIHLFEQLLMNILSNLKDGGSQLSNNQEQNFSLDYHGQQQHQSDLSSTFDNIDYPFNRINQLKNLFEDNKKLLLDMPLDKNESKKFIQNNQVYSKVSTSYVNSIIEQNNSQITQRIDKENKLKLDKFIENLQLPNVLLCPIHQQQVEFINVSNDPNIENRRLCKGCGQEGIKLSQFLVQYLIQFFEFKISLETKISCNNKKIIELCNLMQSQTKTINFYNDMKIKFNNRISLIGNIFESQLYNIDDINLMAQDYVKTQDLFLKLNKEFDQEISQKMKEDLLIVQNQITRIIDNLNKPYMIIPKSIQDSIQNYKNNIQTNQKSNQSTQNSNQSTQNSNQNTQYISQTTQNNIKQGNNHVYTFVTKIQQSELCQALCFNRNGDLLATAKMNKIIIWSFQLGSMTLISELHGHNKEISCLQFDKYTDTLISAGGDFDQLIVVWGYLGNDIWEEKVTIKNYIGIKVMIFDSKCNQLFFGCQKGIIKNYIYHQSQAMIEFKFEKQLQSNQAIFGLSINDSSTLIASCGNDMNIRVHQLDQQFSLLYQLNCGAVGTRIQFIDDKSFVLVQKDGWLNYYQIEWQNIKVIQKISLSSETRDFIFSPIYFNKAKQLLIVKHYRTIYFFSRKSKENFEKFDTIEYQSNLLFSTTSQNGNYLVNWINQEKDEDANLDQIKHYHVYELQYQQI